MVLHKHWTISAYKRRIKIPLKDIPQYGKYRFDEVTEVALDADSEKEARQKAKQTIKRKGYYVQKVFACEQDHELDTEIKIRSLAYQEKMVKELLLMKEK